MGQGQRCAKRSGGIFIDFDELVKSSSPVCEPEVMDAEDPLFILYTSGTTGKPKGVLHTTGGYMVGTYFTTKITFDLKEDDIYWCTADIGWITGHSYIVYGPLANGVTSLITEGAPDYPDPGRWWSYVERYRVNVFYTAPTAIRMFMRYGEQWPAKYDLSSLRVLGSVGEPINPECLALVLRTHRKKELRHSRYMVANRNRHAHDNHHTLIPRKARKGRKALLWSGGGCG